MLPRLLAASILSAGALALAACTQSPQPAAHSTPAPAAQATPAPAQPNVADLVGARASSGEGEMQRRGYSVARQRGLTAFWWNASARSCVETVTADGRYRTVQPVAAANCGH